MYILKAVGTIHRFQVELNSFVIVMSVACLDVKLTWQIKKRNLPGRLGGRHVDSFPVFM